MLHFETILPETLDLMRRILARPVFAQARLVGGTALALQLGHRVSEDFDVFGEWNPDEPLAPVLSECGTVTESGGSGRIQSFFVDGVKVDCVRYPYAWIADPVVGDGFRLADVRDIAPMKLAAVASRGSRKDFVDVAFLLKRLTIREMLALYREKYPDGNEYLVLRSLCWFADAEAQPMPRMLAPFDWNAAKREILAAVEAAS